YDDIWAGGSYSYHNGVDIVMSPDGVTWTNLWLPLGAGGNGTWNYYAVDLARAAAQAGITIGPEFRIKLRHFSERNDETRWDDLSILTSDPADYYRLSLQADRQLSLAVEGLQNGQALVELLDADGTVLASGTPGAANADSVIAGFVAPDDGVYYVRVTAPAGCQYSLVATRGAAFDVEPNNDAFGRPQALGAGEVVLGDLGRPSGLLWGVNAASASTPLRSLYQWDLSCNQKKTVLNLSAPLVGGYNSGLAATDFSLLVATSGPIYEYKIGSWDLLRILPGAGYAVNSMTLLNDEIFALRNTNGSSNPAIDVISYRTGRLLRTLPNASDLYGIVAAGRTLYGTRDNILYTVNPATGVATMVGQLPSGRRILSVLAGEILALTSTSSSSGLADIYDLATFQFKRRVYAGSIDSSAVESLTSDEGYSDDTYTFTANAGDRLVITTSNPSAGRVPSALLDPKAALYAPDGTLLASDDNSAPDGRNVQLQYAVTATGTYSLKLSAVGASFGEYILRISRGGPSAGPGNAVAGDWLDGDANLDGQVSLLDYNIVRTNFGNTYPTGENHRTDGDVNGDGEVSLLDFNIVTVNFGRAVSYVPLTAETVVPAVAAPSDTGAIMASPADASLVTPIVTNTVDDIPVGPDVQTLRIPLPLVTVIPLATNDPSPAPTGTVDDSAVLIEGSAGDSTYLADDNGDGTWGLQAGTIAPALPCGAYGVQATATGLYAPIGVESTPSELVICTIPGGANLDGQVGLSDYNLIKAEVDLFIQMAAATPAGPVQLDALATGGTPTAWTWATSAIGALAEREKIDAADLVIQTDLSVADWSRVQATSPVAL
ncbi:MAG: pre-peptidase C-terminal domain-containing protein, partial [Planctomycetota bacterium]|nr:pre-peptidase C-terminal domain-containing protein [Planctomycetota bacterium]